MAATFDSGLAELKDRARLAMGDIAAPFLLDDETYEALLTDAELTDSLTDSFKSDVARMLAAVCANKAIEVQQSELRRKYLDRSKFYTEMADRLDSADDDTGTTAGLPQVGVLNAPTGDCVNQMNRLNGLRGYRSTTETCL